MPQTRQLKTIMFTDIEGYTAMMQEDEERTIAFRNKHRQVFDKLTAKFRGEVLQYYGDGTLSVFDSALDAVHCGIEIQKELQQEPKVPVRIGIDSGKIAMDEREVFGEGVTIASLIEKLAESGGVFISGRTFNLVKDPNSVKAFSMGQFDLKNITRPVEIFAISNEGLRVPEKHDVRIKFDRLQTGRSRWQISKITQVLLTGFFLLISVIGLAYLAVYLIEQSSQPVSKSIAVLPFDNLTDDIQQEYLSDGVTEEIINRLTQIQELKVISRTSIMNYKNSDMPLKEIGKELGVSNILEGSIRELGNQVRVSAQLIQVETDHTLWAETYDRASSDIISIQTDLAFSIAEALKARLSEQAKTQIKEETTESVSAYDSYLQALYHFDTYTTQGFYKAINLLEQSIEIDPNFGSSYALLSLCHIYLASWAGDLPPEVARKDAMFAAERALELNDDLHRPYIAMALIKFWFDWDFKEAEWNFMIASQMAHGGAINSFYQQFLINMGRFEEAAILSERAMEIDPLHFSSYLSNGLSHFFLREYDQAEEILKKGIDLHPNILDLHNKLGKVYLNQDKFDQAINQLEKGLSLSTSRPPSMLAYLSVAYIGKGENDKARDLLSELIERDSENEKGICLFVAHIFSGMGDDNKALEWLEKAYEKHEVDLIWLKVEPQFANLYDNPEFKDLLARIGF